MNSQTYEKMVRFTAQHRNEKKKNIMRIHFTPVEWLSCENQEIISAGEAVWEMVL